MEPAWERPRKRELVIGPGKVGQRLLNCKRHFMAA